MHNRIERDVALASRAQHAIRDANTLETCALLQLP
jgi:hypothetical protein